MRIRIRYIVMPASKFRHNLARLRKHRGLDQADVAQLVGCSKTTIQSIELGRLSLSLALAAKLQGALGVPDDWLLENDLKSPIPEPLRLFQAEDIAWKSEFGTFEYLAQMLMIRKQLGSKQELALFQHHIFECVKALVKSFGADYPALTGFRSVKFLKQEIAAFDPEERASLPQPRKAKQQLRSKRPPTRQ